MDVRELITKLGFDVDEATLKKYDGMIVRTKEKLTGLEALQRRVFGLVGVAVAGRAAAAFLGLTAQVENNQVAFKTLLHDGEAAKAMLADLYKFAKETPFGFFEVTDVAKRMMAFGIQAKDIIPTLRTVGDATNALGLGSQGVDRITLAIGQMQAKGRVMTQEMNQMAESGIPAFRYLAKGLGTTVAGAMDMVEKRLVDSQTGLRLVLAGMAKDFGGGMAERMKTLGGQWDMLKQSIQGFFMALGGGRLRETLTRLLTDINRWFDRNSVAIQNFAESAGAALAFIVENAKLFTTALLAWGGAQVILAFVTLLKWLAAINAAQLRLWFTNPYFLIAAAIFAVILALEDLYGWIQGKDSVFGSLFGDFSTVWARIKTEIHTAMKEFGDGFKVMWEGMVAAFTLVVPPWMQALLKLGGKAVGAFVTETVSRPNDYAAGAARTFFGPGPQPAFAGGARAGGGDVIVHVTAPAGTPSEQKEFLKVTAQDIFAQEKVQVMVLKPRREQ